MLKYKAMDEPPAALSGEPVDTGSAALIQYDKLSSPESAQRFDQRIAEEGQLFNYASEAATIRKKKETLTGNIDPILTNDKLSDTELTKALEEISGELNTLSFREKEVGYLNDFMQARAHMRESSGAMLFGSFEPDVQPLITGIVSAAQTTDTEFVPQERFEAAVDNDQPHIDIDASRDPIEVPLSAIVSAIGFESWERGRGENTLKDGKPSAEFIKHYASLPTEIPPIDTAQALILPNGKVVIMSHDAHRVAAAKLKGQHTMRIKYLKVRKAKFVVGDA